jgi:bifunctional NMN adenylyltransferase/nudix hydrolase
MPKAKVAPSKVGIIYAPFQVPDIGRSEYADILDGIKHDHETLIFLLPVRRMPPSPSVPLDFRTRKGMLEYDGYDLVFPVTQHKYPKDQVAALDAAIGTAMGSLQNARYVGTPVTLWVDSSFETTYREHTKKKHRLKSKSFIAIERTLREGSFSDVERNEYFRHGVIDALHAQFPVQFPVVDIAIFRRTDSPSTTQLLLGRKPGETNFRFPGGFKDRTDKSLEVSVIREAQEETLAAGVDGTKVFTYPKYIGSMNVNEWRYADDPWGIVTMFFRVDFTGKESDIKAGDDLEEVKWFDLEEIKASNFPIEGEHVHLLRMLISTLV